MESFFTGRSIVDIKATTLRHLDIVDHLPGMHALTGCDTTSFIYSIWKTTALKVFEAGKTIKIFEEQGSNHDEVNAEAVSFLASCYGLKQQDNLSDVRYKLWLRKMANPRIACVTKLKSFPATT